MQGLELRRRDCQRKICLICFEVSMTKETITEIILDKITDETVDDFRENAKELFNITDRVHDFIKDNS